MEKGQGVIVAHVDEVRSAFSGGQTNVICSGVKLLKFGEVWCGVLRWMVITGQMIHLLLKKLESTVLAT